MGIAGGCRDENVELGRWLGSGLRMSIGQLDVLELKLETGLDGEERQ